jgi:hypothetical protein
VRTASSPAVPGTGHGSAGRAESAVQRRVHDLVSLQYQRMSAHAEPPSATIRSADRWSPHSQHSTTAGPPRPVPGSVPMADRGDGLCVIESQPGLSALLMAQSGLSRRLPPWPLLVHCRLAARSLITGCPGSLAPGSILILIVVFCRVRECGLRLAMASVRRPVIVTRSRISASRCAGRPGTDEEQRGMTLSFPHAHDHFPSRQDASTPCLRPTVKRSPAVAAADPPRCGSPAELAEQP